jgi:hypothetical protein
VEVDIACTSYQRTTALKVRLIVLGYRADLEYLVLSTFVDLPAALDFVTLALPLTLAGTKTLVALIYEDPTYKIGVKKLIYNFPDSINLANIYATIPENVNNPRAVGANLTTAQMSLVSGSGSADNNLFLVIEISGDYYLEFQGSADFETRTQYSVRIGGTDNSGAYERVVVISVLNVNEPPENLKGLGFALVLDGSNTDNDFNNATGAYTLLASYGVGTASVIYDSTGRIAWTGVPGSIPSNWAFGGRFKNEASGDEFDTALVLEGNPVPTDIALLTSTDPDANETPVYGLVSGVGDEDNSAFLIDGNYLKIALSTNYEVKKLYRARIRSTTSGGLYVEGTLVVNVVQVPETPTDIFLSSANIGGLGTIGNLSAIDQDANSNFTYSIVGGTLASYLTIVGSDLVLATELTGSETALDVTIRCTDETGLWFEKAFVLNGNIQLSYSPTLSTAALNNILDDSPVTMPSVITIVMGSSAILMPSVLTSSISSNVSTAPANQFILQN